MVALDMFSLQAHKDQIIALIQEAVVLSVPRDRLGHVEITEGPDSTGDDSIFVKVFLVNSIGGFGASIHFIVSEAVHEAMRNIGEDRYAYVMFKYVAVAA